MCLTSSLCTRRAGAVLDSHSRSFCPLPRASIEHAGMDHLHDLVVPSHRTPARLLRPEAFAHRRDIVQACETSALHEVGITIASALALHTAPALQSLPSATTG